MKRMNACLVFSRRGQQPGLDMVSSALGGAQSCTLVCRVTEETMKNRKNLFPLLMMIAGAVLILGAVAFVITSSLTSSQVKPTAAAPADPLAAIPRVNPEEAKAAFDSGQAIFVDVRDEQAYNSQHVAGALFMPLDQVPDRLSELDPQAWIITY